MDAIHYKILLALIGFLAGIINTLAGGGSLITLPIFIFYGLPPAVANATNRITIVVQSLTGTLGYHSKGVHTFPFNIYLGLTASIGALFGAWIALRIDGSIFNKILAILMVIVVFLLLFKPNVISQHTMERVTGKYFFLALLGFFFIIVHASLVITYYFNGDHNEKAATPLTIRVKTPEVFRLKKIAIKIIF